MLPIQSRSLWEKCASRTLTVTVQPVGLPKSTRPGQFACAIRPGRLELIALAVILVELLTASAARQERRPEAEQRCCQPEEWPVHPQAEWQARQRPEEQPVVQWWWQAEQLRSQGWRLPASRRPSAS